jgi:hypothetical protein
LPADPRVGPVDIVDAEGNAADSDVVEGRVGLALRQRVDELDQVEHTAFAPPLSAPRASSSPRVFPSTESDSSEIAAPFGWFRT